MLGIVPREERRRAFHRARNERMRQESEAARAAETNRLRAGAYDALRAPLGPVTAGTLSGALDFVPVVGDLSGAEDTYQAAKAGDYGAAAVNAGGTLLGIMPVLGDAAGAALGIFAGALARNADHVKLGRAQEMAASGADPRAVWDETGWFQGADGKWRFEIDDSRATADWQKALSETGEQGAARKGIPFGGVVDHQELFKAHPDASDVLVRGLPRTSLQGAPGGYAPTQDWMALATDIDDEAARSVGLHEMQHRVQKTEGFAHGSGPDAEAKAITAEITHKVEILRGDLRNILDEQPALKRAYDRWKTLVDAGNFKKAGEFSDAIFAAPNGERVMLLHMEIDDVQAAAKSAGRYRYERVAGEVEARNVQARRDMTPEQRRATPPWETEDTPRDRQIVRFR